MIPHLVYHITTCIKLYKDSSRRGDVLVYIQENIAVSTRDMALKFQVLNALAWTKLNQEYISTRGIL